MKFIKPYHIFENKEMIDAGVLNALNNNNIELFKGLSEQYGDQINYEYVMKRIWGNKWYKGFGFFKYVPMSHTSHITTVNIGDSVVPSLDVSGLYFLEEIGCSGNGNDMKELITTGLKLLKTIDVTNNYIKTLDVTTNVNLRHLHCEHNLITELDLTKNTNIKVLHTDQHVKVKR